MTLSLYSTYKAWRRDRAAERGAGGAPAPTSGIGAALVQLGLGLGGIGAGGDPATTAERRT